MLALISPAKTMNDAVYTNMIDCTTPRFLDHTAHIASQMQSYNSEELEEIFKISTPLAQELNHRFTSFSTLNTNTTPAIYAYDGVVFKHLKGDNAFTISQLEYLQNTVRISSLMWGLLKPLDLIKPYRMEGFVRLSGTDERVDKYWRDKQTDILINDVKEAGGTLLYLASKEEQNAFNWREVKKQINVIDIQFLQQKGDKLRQVVIYTKMARGEMVRYMLQNNVTSIDQLKQFEWNGYTFRNELSDSNTLVWVM